MFFPCLNIFSELFLLQLAHAEKIYLVQAYPKSEKDSLTKGEKADLKKLVNILKGEDQ